MIRKGIAIAPLVLAIGCGSAATKAPERPTAAASKKKTAKRGLQPLVADGGPVETRKVGDYFVYRYSGSYTAEPITVTEQVVGEELGVLVVDFVLEQKDEMTAIRVRMQPGGRIVSAAKIGPSGEVPAEISDYEVLMSRTQFVPDSNDELVTSEDATCLVGKDEADCHTTTYVVRIGEKEGILSVTKSDAVVGRDVAGEVLGPDGDLIYRAELVETGHEAQRTSAVTWAGKSLKTEPPK